MAKAAVWTKAQSLVLFCLRQKVVEIESMTIWFKFLLTQSWFEVVGNPPSQVSNICKKK